MGCSCLFLANINRYLYTPHQLLLTLHFLRVLQGLLLLSEIYPLGLETAQDGGRDISAGKV
jgi:hypothetical protein